MALRLRLRLHRGRRVRTQPERRRTASSCALPAVGCRLSAVGRRPTQQIAHGRQPTRPPNLSPTRADKITHASPAAANQPKRATLGGAIKLISARIEILSIVIWRMGPPSRYITVPASRVVCVCVFARTRCESQSQSRAPSECSFACRWLYLKGVGLFD